MAQALLEMKDIHKSFKGAEVLKGIDLTIPENTVYGLLGQNGAGKSTLLKILTGMLRYDSGEILLAGKQLAKQDFQMIGSLIENPALYPNLTAFENLKVQALLLGVSQMRIKEVLAVVGLASVDSKKKAKQFSLGMKQRLGIAMALLGKPKLLILDEPTNGLDPVGIQELRQMIQKFPEQGITVLISSHILSEIQKVSNEIGIIHNGVMEYEGSISEVDDLEKLFMTILTKQQGGIQ